MLTKGDKSIGIKLLFVVGIWLSLLTKANFYIKLLYSQHQRLKTCILYKYVNLFVSVDASIWTSGIVSSPNTLAIFPPSALCADV